MRGLSPPYCSIRSEQLQVTFVLLARGALSLGLEGPAQQPTPVFLPGESHGQRNLAGCSPWDHKESGTTEAT